MWAMNHPGFLFASALLHCSTAPRGMFAKCSSVPALFLDAILHDVIATRISETCWKKRKRKDNSWLMRELLTDNSRSFSSLKFAINHSTGVALAAAASNFSRCIYRSNLRTLMVRGVTSIKLESDTGDDVVHWDQRDVNRGFLSCKVC